MTAVPSFPELLFLIDDRSAALREALAAAPDLEARVPGCPDWSLRDPSWVLDLTPDGARVDPVASGDPVATVHGSASDILLALFGRIPLDRLRIDGDATVVEQLKSWADTD
jgi:hypothetical protein